MQQLALYVAILRKHLVLLLVSAALVVSAGVFYVWRQEPVFRSTATLTIESPVRNLAAGRDAIDLFAMDQQELQTQALLLRENQALAAAAVERLEAAGIDAAAAGYTPQSLPAHVRVEFVPGTYAVSFSLTGRDAATLPLAVNTYAEVYQEFSARKGELTFESQRRELEKRRTELDAQLAEAERERREFGRDRTDGLNLASGENPAADARNALVAQMPALELRRDEARASRDLTLRALADLGIGVRQEDDRYHLFLAAPGDGPSTLEERLAEGEGVVALEPVNANVAVQHLREEERSAAQRDAELAREGLLDAHRDRKAAVAARRAAHLARGRATAGALEAELARVAAVEAQVAAQERKLEDLRTQANEINALLAGYAERQERVARLERELAEATRQLDDFKSSYLPVEEGPGARPGMPARRVEIATRATPAVQIAPNVPMILGLTAFAALAVGLGLVFLFEYLDDTVKSKEDFDRYVGLPFLGFIPRIEPGEGQNPDLAADARTGSAIAEAFRAVRTSILFSRSDHPVRSILITSAGAGEGKTTVAVNLAATLARQKGPVLLIDADLRRPRIAKTLGLPNERGLTNVLVGELDLATVAQASPIEGLHVVTSGPAPPNPAELLHGERMAELVRAACERYEHVVIDSPPLIAVTDARVLASKVDGLYMVVSAGRTSWRVIQRAVESVTSIGFEVHGAVLNNMAVPTGRYGYYYYRDYAYGKPYYESRPGASS